MDFPRNLLHPEPGFDTVARGHRTQAVEMNGRIHLAFRKITARIMFGALFGHGRRRRCVAGAWLSGSGIEIGALHNPLAVPGAVRVTYVDRMDNEALLSQYPELVERPLVPVDIVDDGETLSTIPDGSQDFVIANHLLEHCENPIGALQAWLRVLKTGGIAYVTVPDKRFTFDFRRETTDWAHVLSDYERGPERSRRQHYMDWVRNIMSIGGGEADDACDYIEKNNHSIHFHTWTAKSFKAFFDACRKELAMPLSECDFIRNGIEVIVILKKTE